MDPCRAQSADPAGAEQLGDLAAPLPDLSRVLTSIDPGLLTAPLRPHPTSPPRPSNSTPPLARRRDSSTPERVRARAIEYLGRLPAAVQGANGSAATMWAARVVCWGFDLGPADGFDILNQHFNPRCEPPWSERELHRKCDQAMDPQFRHPRGWLLNTERDRPGRRSSATGAPSAASVMTDSSGVGQGRGSPVCTAPPRRRECLADAGCDGRASCTHRRSAPRGASDLIVGEQVRASRTLSPRQQLVEDVIGPAVPRVQCDRPFVLGMTGVAEDNAGDIGVGEIRCGNCDACRPQEVYGWLREAVPVLLVRGNGYWEGTAEAWEVVRKRLERLLAATGYAYVRFRRGHWLTFGFVIPPEMFDAAVTKGVRPLSGEPLARRVAAAAREAAEVTDGRRVAKSRGWDRVFCEVADELAREAAEAVPAPTPCPQPVVRFDERRGEDRAVVEWTAGGRTYRRDLGRPADDAAVAVSHSRLRDEWAACAHRGRVHGTDVTPPRWELWRQRVRARSLDELAESLTQRGMRFGYEVSHISDGMPVKLVIRGLAAGDQAEIYRLLTTDQDDDVDESLRRALFGVEADVVIPA